MGSLCMIVTCSRASTRTFLTRKTRATSRGEGESERRQRGHGAVKLPPLAGTRKHGQSKKCFAHDLLAAWQGLLDEGVDLPPLIPGWKPFRKSRLGGPSVLIEGRGNLAARTQTGNIHWQLRDDAGQANAVEIQTAARMREAGKEAHRLRNSRVFFLPAPSTREKAP